MSRHAGEHYCDAMSHSLSVHDPFLMCAVVKFSKLDATSTVVFGGTEGRYIYTL